MDTSVGQRIKTLLYEYRYKQVDILKQLKWDIEEKKTTISYWLRQENSQYLEFLAGVFELFPQINPYWILTGKGEKLISNQTNSNAGNQKHSSTQELIPTYKVTNDKQLDRVIIILEEQIHEKDKTINRVLSQLDEKDKTINQLLSLLDGNNKKKE
jgi:hypothetical protein